MLKRKCRECGEEFNLASVKDVRQVCAPCYRISQPRRERIVDNEPKVPGWIIAKLMREKERSRRMDEVMFELWAIRDRMHNCRGKVKPFVGIGEWGRLS